VTQHSNSARGHDRNHLEDAFENFPRTWHFELPIDEEKNPKEGLFQVKLSVYCR
jgi:hypothetical protein